MAKRNIKHKKGSHTLSKQTYYVLAIILIILICIGIYCSISATKEPKIKPVETQTTIILPDTIKKKEEIVKPKTDTPKPKTDTPKHTNVKHNKTLHEAILELPKIKSATYLHHNKEGRYRVHYSPKDKIPSFVSYILTRKESERNIVKRGDKFTADPYYIKLNADLATDNDYRRSGYDRGHMIPSADRNDSEIENMSTFNYSNIAPQRPALNRKTINALEQKIREWALKYDSLHIITGSILSDNSNRPIEKIGKGVSVPQYFYKVIAVKSGGSYKTIGFIMPNIESVDPDYNKYMVSVDEVENRSKNDFFYILPDSIENRVEKEIDTKFWK